MSQSTQPEFVHELADWLISAARLIVDTATLDQEIVNRLRASGLPIVRYSTGVPSLHPQVDSFSTLWEEGKGLSFRQYRVSDDPAQQFARSPIFLAYETGGTVRCRLDGPPEEDEYEILAEFRAQGLTDYLVIALPFSDGSNKAMSFATDRAGGFNDAEIAGLEGLRHMLAATLEVRYLRHMAETLMQTYVGPIAGRRVLNGAIRRGSGETIRAAIWFCDLKGFTPLSEHMPGQQMLDMLNSYFDVVAAAIESNGGEILKFIGDAVLAIFQPPEGDEPDAARRALDAARSALADLERTNAARRALGLPEIECGIALNFGDLVYGNVGSEKRLDFTVIGPAVNLASRLEGLTRQVGRPVIVSEAFSTLHGGDFEPLGPFTLKGIERPEQVFAPCGR
jgi:adenylate cyclase